MELESSCPSTEDQVETEPVGENPQPQRQPPQERDPYRFVWPTYHGDGGPWRVGQ